MRAKIIFFYICFFATFILKAQTPTIDSLLSELPKHKEDTNRAKNLMKLSWEYTRVDLKKSDSICQIQLRLSKKLNYSKGIVQSYNTLGTISIYKNKSHDAIYWYKHAIAECKKSNNIKGLATSYNNLGNVYDEIGDKENALIIYRKALIICSKAKNIKVTGDLYNNIGIVYLTKGVFDSALYYCHEALKIRTTLNNQSLIADSYNNLSALYTELGDVKTSSFYLFKTLKIYEQTEDVQGLIYSYLNLATNYFTVNDFKNAKLFTEKSNSLARRGSFESSLANGYNLLNQIFYKLNNLDSSKYYGYKAYNYAITMKDALLQSEVLSNIHLVFVKEKNFYSADTCLKKSIKLAEANKLESELIGLLIMYANFKIELNENSEVLLLLNQANEKTNNLKLNSNLNRVELSKAYFNYYKKIGKAQLALTYLEDYTDLKDSLFNSDIVDKIIRLQALYSLEKKDKEIKLLKQDAQVNSLLIKEKNFLVRQRNLTILLIAIAVLLILIGYLLYSRNQKLINSKKRLELIKETQVNERARIAKDIHDELGSGLTRIKFLGEVTQSQNKDVTIQKNLKTISETVYSLVDNMRDLIWALNPNNTTLDNLLARIREYCSDYVEEIDINLKISFPDVIPNLTISNQAHRNIFLTIKEVLQNTVKHSQASEAQLNIRIENEVLYVNFSDNGKGFDIYKHKNLESNGLLNMKYRIETIGGKYSIESTLSSGTVIKFEIKLAEINNEINTLV